MRGDVLAMPDTQAATSRTRASKPGIKGDVEYLRILHLAASTMEADVEQARTGRLTIQPRWVHARRRRAYEYRIREQVFGTGAKATGRHVRGTKDMIEDGDEQLADDNQENAE